MFVASNLKQQTIFPIRRDETQTFCYELVTYHLIDFDRFNGSNERAVSRRTCSSASTIVVIDAHVSCHRSRDFSKT